MCKSKCVGVVLMFLQPPSPTLSSMATASDLDTKKRVLCVGLVCLDIIKIVDSFPLEDTDQRCIDCLWRRGGNAANTASVLSLLGAPTEFLGTLAKGPYLQFLQTDCGQYGVSTDHCPLLENTASPVSVVILNSASGSRTILHTNTNLRELTFEDFQRVPLASGQYSWIHLEGRPNTGELQKIVLYVEDHNASCEESRPLMGHVDVVFISKEVAQSLRFTDCRSAVEALAADCKQGGTVICPWGDKGAAGKRKDGPVVVSPAFPPDVVMDTIGAGDTFNAAAIFALNTGKSLQDAVTFGCRVAGAKCGMMGNEGLRGMVFS
ncbi:hypothetical protein BaRGS_00026624 [Batillaria attramentaria]|uniref:Carbohydrate kinase PfkB domain-containing protein n=1 Tax=Batillaria attramentaria TaxID=370345 RepID=A0ABD0K4Z5_9CAEN